MPSILDYLSNPMIQAMGQTNPMLAAIANSFPKQSVVDQAVNQYPILKNLNVVGQQSIGQQPYKLEFWPPGETGSQDYQRPQNIPINSIGVQIFDKSVTPKDVLADITSHYLINNDKTVKNLYNQFKSSITKDQQERLKNDYKWAQTNENESRPYNQWLEQTRLPAYFRGYTFDQWPNDFNQKVFTKEQFKIFDKLRNYLGVQ